MPLLKTAEPPSKTLVWVSDMWGALVHVVALSGWCHPLGDWLRWMSPE